MSAKNWLKFIALGLIWGSSFLWIKIALREVGPLTLVTFRTFFATLGLILVALIRKPTIRKKDIWVLAVLGFLNVAFPFALISWSELRISSGMAAILNATNPLFTSLLAPWFLTDEKWTLQRVLGLLVGFGGVIVLMSEQVDANISLKDFGILAMLVAACCYAASGIFARKQNRGMRPEGQALGQLTSAFLFIFPAAATVEAPFHIPTLPITYLALVWLGLLGSCVATLLWFSLVNSVGPTRTAMTNYVFPLVGVILGVIFLGEHVDWRLLLGGCLIILAVVLVNTRRHLVRRSGGGVAIDSLEQEND